MPILETKKDMRALQFSNLDKLPKFDGDDIEGLYDLKVLPTARVIVQKPYLSSIRSADDLVLDPLVKKDGIKYVVERDPTQKELEDLLTASYINIFVRTSARALYRNFFWSNSTQYALNFASDILSSIILWEPNILSLFISPVPH